MFENCGKLNIEVDEDNNDYSSYEGVLLSKDKRELIAYAKDAVQPVYTTPDFVTTIGYEAFQGCSYLTKITVSDSVTNIESSAFRRCRSLAEVSLPDELINLGAGVFEGTQLEYDDSNWEDGKVLYIDGYLIETKSLSGSYAIRQGTKGIAGSAFYWRSITDISIPDSVTTIGERAFCPCNDLTEIKLSEGLKYINDDAFQSCAGLTKVDLPQSLVMIGDDAFRNCTNLSDISLPDNITQIGQAVFLDTAYYNNTENWEDNVLYIGKYLLDANNLSGDYTIKDGTELVADYAFAWDCTELADINIPNSVCYIGKYAFYECKKLISVSLPKGITKIDSLFGQCMDLRCVYIPDTVKYIDYSTFRTDSGISDVYYEGSEEDWDKIQFSYDGSNIVRDDEIILRDSELHFNSNGIPVPSVTSLTVTKNNDYYYELNPTVENIPYSCSLIMAIYNNGTLTGISERYLSTVYEIDPVHIRTEFIENSDTIKTFIWNDVSGMRSLCEAKEFSIK